MKVLITGTTRGFGSYLFHFMDRQGPGRTVSGANRRDGYEIDTTNGREKLVTTSLSHDVFINNAWSEEKPDAQCVLFQEIWHAWKNKGKDGTIINIGSRAGTDIDQIAKHSPYHISKRKLLEVSDEYARRRHPGIIVSCLNFGYLDMPKNRGRRYLLEFWHAASLVDLVISRGPTVQIRNMTVEAVPYGDSISM